MQRTSFSRRKVYMYISITSISNIIKILSANQQLHLQLMLDAIIEENSAIKESKECTRIIYKGHIYNKSTYIQNPDKFNTASLGTAHPSIIEKMHNYTNIKEKLDTDLLIIKNFYNILLNKKHKEFSALYIKEAKKIIENLDKILNTCDFEKSFIASNQEAINLIKEVYFKERLLA